MSDEPITYESHKIPAQREIEVFANENGAISIRQEALIYEEEQIVEVRPENIERLIELLRAALSDFQGAE